MPHWKHSHLPQAPKVRWLKQSTTITLRYGPFLDDTDFKTEETGLAGAMVAEVSKNGGAFAARNSATAIAHDSNGWYSIELNGTDTGTLGPLTVKVDASGHLPVWEHFVVIPANVYDSMVAGSDALQVHATEMSANLITSSVIANDALTAAKVAADVTTEIQSGLATAANLATVDTVVDAIKAVTDLLPDAGALSSLAQASALATVDTVVDSILADTGTDGVVVAAGSKTGYSLANGSIQAATFAAAAIDAAALADDAGHELADQHLNRNVAGGSDVGRLVKHGLYRLTNRVAVAAGTLSVYDTDDSTPAFTQTVTTAPGDPITEVDTD